jgi:hypothetical protein
MVRAIETGRTVFLSPHYQDIKTSNEEMKIQKLSFKFHLVA